MSESTADCSVFKARFTTREAAEAYRDRFKTGKRRRKDDIERRALRELLSGIGQLDTGLDLPSGTGRLSPVIGEVCRRVLQADGSLQMLTVAREDHPDLSGGYVQTDAEHIALADRGVDLVFCHRFLHHIHDRAARQRIFAELARITRRYVVASYYAPGHRDMWRWRLSRLLGRSEHRDRPATLQQFHDELAAAGLRLARTQVVRRFPSLGVFCLFERAS